MAEPVGGGPRLIRVNDCQAASRSVPAVQTADVSALRVMDAWHVYSCLKRECGILG